MWIAWALVSSVIYGIWGFVSKISATCSQAHTSFAYQTLGGIAVAVVIIIQTSTNIKYSHQDILLGMLVGALGMLATFFYILALQNGPTSLITSLTSAYPILTIFLARLFLGETISPMGYFGCALAIMGTILIALA